MVKKFDFLVIGSGLAGMSFALKVAHKGKVALICKAGLEEANTYFAQGGIASVTNLKVDNFEKHIEDTMIAGDWISDRAAVEKVVREAPAQIQELIKWGVDFDKKEDGEFDLHKEGGHSEFRILHHKDNTGAEIQTSLIEAVKAHPNITIFTDHYAVEIITPQLNYKFFYLTFVNDFFIVFHPILFKNAESYTFNFILALSISFILHEKNSKNKSKRYNE